MANLPCFDPQHLEAACKVLADTNWGLTGSQIGQILRDMDVADVSPEMTKWQRLYNALITVQNKHQVGNHLIMFINRAMNPVSYARDRQAFDWRRDELNVVLAFSGYYVREDGKVGPASKETTLTGARARAGRTLIPGVQKIYCDESGFTGNRLSDERQPMFSYAAVAVEADEAAEIVADVIRRYHVQSGELKASQLLSRSNRLEIIRYILTRRSRNQKGHFVGPVG